jgi:DNA ligase-1
MDEICGGKGEGVMLKDPNSEYERKRSFSLLKVKRFEDAEAEVIGHARGEGRCFTMCGALMMREKDGTEFKIGSGLSDAMRRKPPKKGSIVTFKFQGRSNAGKPRFPIFLRIHSGM